MSSRFQRYPRRARVGITTLSVLLLAACGSLPGRTPAAGATAPPAATLDGQILLPRELSAPSGGVLMLQLVPRFGGAGQLADARQPFATPPPWRFSLPFPRNAVSDPTLYRLDVSLFDAEGHLRFISDGEHPVNLDVEAEPTRIELIAIDGSGQQVSELDCDGVLVTLQFEEPRLVLSLDATPHTLRRAHSAVGRRYVGADAELWLQPDRARLQLGEQHFNCVVTATATG